MTKNEFKQGDKVKLKEYKEFTCNNVLIYIDPDKVGVVVQVDGNYLKVNFPDMPAFFLTFHFSDIVPAKPQEIKTDFLTELQELLRKYDARIYDEFGCKCIIDIGIHSDKSKRIKYTDPDWELNADNIMDFDTDY